MIILQIPGKILKEVKIGFSFKLLVIVHTTLGSSARLKNAYKCVKSSL